MQTFSTLFYLKRSKKQEIGSTVPIYMRITVDRSRAEVAIKRSIEPNKWNSKAGKVKGTTAEVKNINSYIDVLRGKIYEHHKKLIVENKPVTAEAIKNSYLGITDRQWSLIEVINYHNKQMKDLIGKEFTATTHNRYLVLLRIIKEFLKWKYKRQDFFLSEIKHEFISDFEFYLKSVRNNNNTTSSKTIRNLKKIIRIALVNEWIKADPFINFKIRVKEVERECLTKEEIQVLIDKELPLKRLEVARDVFIFCCYTGLSYSDLKKLASEHIITGIDGQKWIQIFRTKTDVKSTIPLLPIPLQILEKYKESQEIVNNDKLLPVLSNQKCNAYLKEITNLCKLNKIITMHIGRFSFATTVTLANNVPIESVQAALGHKSIRTTQHYAKVIPRKVSNDFLLLREKLQNENTKKIQDTEHKNAAS